MWALDWSQCPAVESIPGKVSGAWVLRGTRMPVSVIFENWKPEPTSTTSWNGLRGWIASRLRLSSHLPPAALAHSFVAR